MPKRFMAYIPGSTPVGPVGDTTPPSVPTNVTASSITGTGFTLSWTASTDAVGVAGYVVQIDGSTYATPNGTAVLVTGRSPGSTYSVRVQARDAAGNTSALSTAINVSTAAQTQTQTLYSNQVPASGNLSDGTAITLGTVFTAASNGTVSGIRFYAATTLPTSAVGLLFDDAGTELARVSFATPVAGWNSAIFTAPVSVTAGTPYRAAYWTNGPYVASNGLYPITNANLSTSAGCYVYGSAPAFPSNGTAGAYFADLIFAQSAAVNPSALGVPGGIPKRASAVVYWDKATASGGSPVTSYDLQNVNTGAVVNVGLKTSTVVTGLTNGTSYTFKVRANNAVGVGTYSAASPAIVPSATASVFPDATNSGVPAGTTLTTYTGPGGLTGSGTVTIQDKTINDDLRVYDSVKLILRRCRINGHVDADSAAASVLMEDCTINSGTWGNAVIGFQNLTIRRCDVSGGITHVNASINCLVEDCYLHDPYNPGGASHMGSILENGGHDVTISRTTVWCNSPNTPEGGGPSGNLQLYAQLAPIFDVTIDSCLFKPTEGAYGVSLGYNPGQTFGDTPTRIIFTNNTFERGPFGGNGEIGTVTSFLDANGNVFSNNKFTDGTPVVAN